VQLTFQASAVKCVAYTIVCGRNVHGSSPLLFDMYPGSR
jgi:hypothetical protein